MTWLWIVLGYFAIPLLATVVSGRKYTWQGHVFFFLLWPVAWMFINEELP